MVPIMHILERQAYPKKHLEMESEQDTRKMNKRHHKETIMTNINKLVRINVISLKHAILLNPKSFCRQTRLQGTFSLRIFEAGSVVINNSNIPDILTDSFHSLQRQTWNVRITIIWPSYGAKLAWTAKDIKDCAKLHISELVRSSQTSLVTKHCR